MVWFVPSTNKYLTEHGDGHLTSDHYVIGDIFLYVARRELNPIAALPATYVSIEVLQKFYLLVSRSRVE